MDGVSGDRGHVDDGSFGLGESAGEAARQFERGEDVQLEHAPPFGELAMEHAEALVVAGLGRDARIVDQRIDQPALEPAIDLRDEMLAALGASQIGDDMMRPVGVAAAFGRNVLARAGEYPPPALAESLDRGMADAAAGAGKNERLALRHGEQSRAIGPDRQRRYRPPRCVSASYQR